MPIIFLILSTAAVSTLLGHSHQLAGRDFFWPITAGGMGRGGIWLLWVVISKNISSMRKLTLVIIGFLVSAGQRMFCFVKEHPKRNKKYLWINTHMWQWSYLLGPPLCRSWCYLQSFRLHRVWLGTYLTRFRESPATQNWKWTQASACSSWAPGLTASHRLLSVMVLPCQAIIAWN